MAPFRGLPHTTGSAGGFDWMGLNFPLNFNFPYIAVSMREFWSRWHISLSTWFRDYVYIPLGGSQGGNLQAHLWMWITLLLSGLWHGAKWTFILWGAYHALLLSLERIGHIPQRLQRWSLEPLAWSMVMIQVSLGWILFRANNLSDVTHILGKMIFWEGPFIPEEGLRGLVFMGVWLGVETWTYYRMQGKMKAFHQNRWLQSFIWAFMALCCIYFRGPNEQFIYFQF